MFLAWLYGIVVIVAVGGLAAVLYAKLGFMDDEQDDSIMPPGPFLAQPVDGTGIKNEPGSPILSPNFNIKYVKYHSYQVPVVTHSVSVLQVPRYECIPKPIKSEST